MAEIIIWCPKRRRDVTMGFCVKECEHIVGYSVLEMQVYCEYGY